MASGTPQRAAPALAISPLGGAELRDAAALLGRAFRDNAMNRAVVGGSLRARERSNAAGMRAVLPLASKRGVVLAARSGVRLAGVLVALPSGVITVGRPSWLTMLQLLVAQRPRVAARWSAVAEALQLHRPLAPHAYLATLGIEPELQRAGAGRALLAHWLGVVDAARQRAYLETDSTSNVSWYERFGFEVRTELTVLGVTVHLMERSPRDA
jgi:ribosomal protein S18 acetylase RimI-like enzyme